MTVPVLEILETGPGVALQDEGRRGWKRFGVPPGGSMDAHAARWANLLVGNPPTLPLVEILLHGARFRTLEPIEIALTGAAVSDPTHRWETRVLVRDELLSIPPPGSGLWTYLAIRGGFAGTRWFGSVSIFPRGGLGRAMERGDLLHAERPPSFTGRPEIGRRWVIEPERRSYAVEPRLRVWKGPQWDAFTEETHRAFFTTPWRISSRSDRTGYRLEGPPLDVALPSLPSEPVLTGSIQIPPDGQPIVTMRDGPTVGGYPKLGLVDPEDLSRLTQCRPGQSCRFEAAPEPPSPPPDHA